MSRACTECGRVVAEAAYCPFCSALTLEYIPRRKEEVNAPPEEEEPKPSRSKRFWTWLFLFHAIFWPLWVWLQVDAREQRIKLQQLEAENERGKEEFRKLEERIKEFNQQQQKAQRVQ